MRPIPAKPLASSLLIAAVVFAAANSTTPTASAEPYCEIFPRQPLVGPPYPTGTRIDGNHVSVAKSVDLVWFDVYCRDWAPYYLRNLQVILRTSEVASIDWPAVPCDGDPAPCVAAFGEGAECLREEPWCNAALVDPVRATETFELFGPEAGGATFGWYEGPGQNSSVGLASLSNEAWPDPGVPVYVGTIVFDVIDEGNDAIEFWRELSAAGLAETPVFNQSFKVNISEQSMGASVEVRPGLPDFNANKSRFVTIPADGLGVGALLVRGIDIAGNAEFNGEERWVGAPYEYPLTRNPAPTAFAANTQCAQHVQDWSGLGDLDIAGPFIQPGRGNEIKSMYEIEFLSEACLNETGPCDGPVFPVETAYWGDLGEPIETGDPLSSQPNIFDVIFAVSTFRGLNQGPPKAFALLADDTPGYIDATRDVRISDILDVVDSFLSKPYPHGGPQACP